MGKAALFFAGALLGSIASFPAQAEYQAKYHFTPAGQNLIPAVQWCDGVLVYKFREKESMPYQVEGQVICNFDNVHFRYGILHTETGKLELFARNDERNPSNTSYGKDISDLVEAAPNHDDFKDRQRTTSVSY